MLPANKASIQGEEAGESLVDAFELFRIGNLRCARSTLKASAGDALTHWATGISFSGCLALMGGLPMLISPTPPAPADGSLVSDCPATTPARCQLRPVQSTVSPKHVASSLDGTPDVFINKLTDQTIQPCFL